MPNKFLYQVGVELVFQRERAEGGVKQFFAQRISDDKYETPLPQVFYGTTIAELARNVKSSIIEEVGTSQDFSWAAQRVKVDLQNVLVSQMSHQEFEVDFMSAMSFAPVGNK